MAKKSKQIRGILFDMGGILVFTPGPTSIELFSRRLVKNYGVSIRNLKGILEKVLMSWNAGRENAGVNFWRKFCKKLGIKDAPLHRFNSSVPLLWPTEARP